MAIEQILFYDAETYYDSSSYTLKKQTPPEYILDDKFELIIVSVKLVKLGQGPGYIPPPSTIVDGPDFGEYLATIDPSVTGTVTFNALFDNCITSWRYGWTPARMCCSMSLARALLGHKLRRYNLATVSSYLGIGHKGNTIANVNGMRRADIMRDAPLWQNYKTYCIDDNELSYGAWLKLIGKLPDSEQRIMDMVLRCAIEPRFRLDEKLLENHLHQTRVQKLELVLGKTEARALIDEYTPMSNNPIDDIQQSKEYKTKITELRSQQKFTDLLALHGVEVEYKTSATTGKLVPAFAKTDGFMEKLQEHPDPRVQALACARLSVKSTLEETRTARLLKIARLPWESYRDGNPRLYIGGGTAPIALRYGGAHTHRLSGDWKLNMQNMPRKSPLRRALVAPDGYCVVKCDLAQIEARLVAWLAGCKKLLDEFRKIGGDPYSAFATLIFGRHVNRKYVAPDGTKPDEILGFIGKTGVLGLGFGCGDEKFYNMVLMLARIMKVDLRKLPVPWTKQLASKVVATYRTEYQEIPFLWKRLEFMVQNAWSINSPGFKHNIGPLTIEYGRVIGPNGLAMEYEDPRQEYDLKKQGNEYKYDYAGNTHRMYGPKMAENIIQYLARIIVMNAALRLACLGYKFVLQAHDELVFLVRLDDRDNAARMILREMRRPPSWGKDIPLDAELSTGNSYGDCKEWKGP